MTSYLISMSILKIFYQYGSAIFSFIYTDSFRYSNELRVTLSALELVSENVNFNFFTN